MADDARWTIIAECRYVEPAFARDRMEAVDIDAMLLAMGVTVCADVTDITNAPYDQTIRRVVTGALSADLQVRYPTDAQQAAYLEKALLGRIRLGGPVHHAEQTDFELGSFC